MNLLHRAALSTAIASVVLLGACSSTPVAPVTPVMSPKAETVAPAPKAVAEKPAAPAPTMTGSVDTKPLPPYLDPKNALSRDRSFYFDFDKALLKPEATSLLEMHGKFLAANPSVKIRVEGNTDEAGGEEYNLALGQRRAQSVVTALKVFGVKDSQMEAISFGKTQPKAMGHDEAAHTQNRRADLAYPAQ